MYSTRNLSQYSVMTYMGKETDKEWIYVEKEMATSSSVLAWQIPWTEEPGRLQSLRLQKSQTRLNN